MDDFEIVCMYICLGVFISAMLIDFIYGRKERRHDKERMEKERKAQEKKQDRVGR